MVAVVARIDHAGLAGEACRSERREQTADVVVDEADETEVGGDRLAQPGFVETLVVNLALAQRGDVGMIWPLVLGIEPRTRHPFLGIEIVPLRSCDQREVWADEGDEQNPALAAMSRCDLAQPALGRIRDRLVLALIVGGRKR